MLGRKTFRHSTNNNLMYCYHTRHFMLTEDLEGEGETDRQTNRQTDRQTETETERRPKILNLEAENRKAEILAVGLVCKASF